MLKAAWRGVADYVRSVPGTYVWLLILLVTTTMLGFYRLAMIRGRTFTDVGHFTATLVGLGCFPVVAGRESPMARGWRWRGLVAEPPFG